jgi:hypothetical protein
MVVLARKNTQGVAHIPRIAYRRRQIVRFVIGAIGVPIFKSVTAYTFSSVKNVKRNSYFFSYVIADNRHSILSFQLYFVILL